MSDILALLVIVGGFYALIWLALYLDARSRERNWRRDDRL